MSRGQAIGKRVQERITHVWRTQDGSMTIKVARLETWDNGRYFATGTRWNPESETLDYARIELDEQEVSILRAPRYGVGWDYPDTRPAIERHLWLLLTKAVGE